MLLQVGLEEIRSLLFFSFFPSSHIANCSEKKRVLPNRFQELFYWRVGSNEPAITAEIDFPFYGC